MDMNLFKINTTAYEDEDFTILTLLNEEQIIKVITPIVNEEREGGNFYDNDDLINALIKAYPNYFISQYNEPTKISI